MFLSTPSRLASISVAGLALALLAPSAAHAQNLITDDSFEDSQLGSGGYQYINGMLNGWLYTGYAVLINAGAGSPWTDGNQGGFGGDQFAGVQINGTLSQTFDAKTSGALDISWLDNARPGNTQNYSVTVVDNATGTAVATQTYTVSSGPTFNPESLRAALVAGQSYTITFQGIDTAVSPGADETAFIDNIDIGAAPAPVIGGLPFGMPILAFAWLRRRRRASTVIDAAD